MVKLKHKPHYKICYKIQYRASKENNSAGVTKVTHV